MTALIWAAKGGLADLVRLFLDAGVDKNAKDDVRLGATGLVWVFGVVMMVNTCELLRFFVQFCVYSFACDGVVDAVVA